MATPAKKRCFVRIPLLLLNFFFRETTAGCRNRSGPGDSPCVDDFSAIFGSQSKRALRTLVRYVQRAHVMHQVPSVFRFDDARGQKDRPCSHPLAPPKSSFPHNKAIALLLDAGTGRGPGDSLRVDDFSSLFGTHPKSEFRTLVG